MTLGIDIGFVKLILAHAAAVHGLPVKVEPVDLARIALKRLGLIGKGNQRDRRPTQDELDRLIAHFDSNPRQMAPVSQIIRFAVATAMRQEEICKARWSDLETRTRMLLIRDRKDPRNKSVNNQRIPLFAATGYDAWTIVGSSGPCEATTMMEFSHSITGQSAPPSGEGAVTWAYTTFIFMTCGTKERVASSKLDSRLNKWPWSRGQVT